MTPIYKLGECLKKASVKGSSWSAFAFGKELTAEFAILNVLDEASRGINITNQRVVYMYPYTLGLLRR